MTASIPVDETRNTLHIATLESLIKSKRVALINQKTINFQFCKQSAMIVHSCQTYSRSTFWRVNLKIEKTTKTNSFLSGLSVGECIDDCVDCHRPSHRSSKRFFTRTHVFFFKFERCHKLPTFYEYRILFCLSEAHTRTKNDDTVSFYRRK